MRVNESDAAGQSGVLVATQYNLSTLTSSRSNIGINMLNMHLT